MAVNVSCADSQREGCIGDACARGEGYGFWVSSDAIGVDDGRRAPKVTSSSSSPIAFECQPKHTSDARLARCFEGSRATSRPPRTGNYDAVSGPRPRRRGRQTSRRGGLLVACEAQILGGRHHDEGRRRARSGPSSRLHDRATSSGAAGSNRLRRLPRLSLRHEGTDVDDGARAGPASRSGAQRKPRSSGCKLERDRGDQGGVQSCEVGLNTISRSTIQAR